MEAAAAAVAFLQLSELVYKCMSRCQHAMERCRNIYNTFQSFSRTLSTFRSYLNLTGSTIGEMSYCHSAALHEKDVADLMNDLVSTCSTTVKSIKVLSRKLRRTANKYTLSIQLPHLLARLMLAAELKQMEKELCRIEPVKNEIILFASIMNLRLKVEQVQALEAHGQAVPDHLVKSIHYLLRENKRLSTELTLAEQRYRECLLASHQTTTPQDQSVIKELEKTRTQLATLFLSSKKIVQSNKAYLSNSNSLATSSDTSVGSKQGSDSGNLYQPAWPARKSAQDLLHIAAKQRAEPSSAAIDTQRKNSMKPLDEADGLAKIVEGKLQSTKDRITKLSDDHNKDVRVNDHAAVFMWHITDDGCMEREEQPKTRRHGA